MQPKQELIQYIQESAVSLNNVEDLTALTQQISSSRIVMLGESSHGTQEFYEWRRLISEILISQHGFNFIAVEGDWPPCWQVNQYIKQDLNHITKTKDQTLDLLKHFNRWPTWMWANTEVIKLVDWLRSYNLTVPLESQVGFYGLDVYSLFESVDVVLTQLKKLNPFLARRAQARYACFEPFQRNERSYARSLFEFPEGCEKQAIEILQELLSVQIQNAREYDEALFDVQQNARIVSNAENYYRTMMHGHEDSWNVRDRHMTETLGHLLNRLGPHSKAIVWAHNTHIGDYRATDMERAGQINLGGLARERWGEENVSLVGFSTFQGEVIASHAWDGPTETMTVPPGRADSYERAFHEVARTDRLNGFYLNNLNHVDARRGVLAEVRGHRAIGVVYHPDYESRGNYVPTSLSRRYDALIYIDKTSALEPLLQSFDRQDIPETWPQGQ